jgi:hypothetical protein
MTLMSASGDEGKVVCQWCSSTAAKEATHCPKCGAALVLRETIGDMVIPGVTHVDPALSQFADEPLHLPRPSPTQGVAGPAIAAAALAGPAGLVALAGLGGLAAAEYLGAGRGHEMTRPEVDKVGELSEPVRRVLERLNEEAKAETPTQVEHVQDSGGS